MGVAETIAVFIVGLVYGIYHLILFFGAIAAIVLLFDKHDIFG